MSWIQKICDYVGVVSEWSGRIVSWLVLILIASIAYDVLMRYFFNAPTNWSYILSYMLGSAVVAVGLPYVHYHNSHIRVDVLYSRLAVRGKLLLDLVLTLLLGLPMMFALAYVFVPDAFESYFIGEVATESIWYPKLWPFKMTVAFALSLLFLQGIANFLKDITRLAKTKKD